jgi:hypothetical protein
VPSTFTVVDLGDAGSGSGLMGDLRYAVNTANSNPDLSNRIVFRPGLTGTITLTQGKLLVSKALGIFGPGADLLTVSGNHQSGVLDVEAPAGQMVFLSDVTIADGTGAGQAEFGITAGGGLFNDAATLVLERTTFSRNMVPFESFGAGGGGAIFNWHGTVTLNDSVITDNQAGEANGVAIRNLGTMAIHDSTVSANPGGLNGTIENNGTMTLDHCAIADNGAGPINSASGVVNNGMLTMTACTITGNRGFEGGGIRNYGRATVTDSTFLNNYGRYGGAIFNASGGLTISGSTVAGNSAQYGGGGIMLMDGQLGMTNSTVSGNVVQFDGGGIYYNSGVLEVTSSTIAFNATTVHFSAGDAGGGGVYAEAGRALIRNTIVADNRTAQDGPDVLGPMLSLGYNLIGQTDASSGWVAADRTGTAAGPLDPRLGPLQDNGGPTPTHALLAGSPALQAGDPAALMSLDQRGSVRGRAGIFGIPGDIGAFDANQATQFRLLAPASVGAGQPFALPVVALDQWGNVASTYTGTVHFSSTDLFAQLPDDTAFSGDDAGAHTFSLTLTTAGQQTIQVDDTGSPFGSGSVTVDVAGATPPGGGMAFLADLLCWKRSTGG